MPEKAYVLKFADRIITSNCNAYVKNGRLIIKEGNHSIIMEVCLNTDTVTPYEITFSSGANKVTAYGSAQRGATLIRRHLDEIIIVLKRVPSSHQIRNYMKNGTPPPAKGL